MESTEKMIPFSKGISKEELMKAVHEELDNYDASLPFHELIAAAVMSIKDISFDVESTDFYEEHLGLPQWVGDFISAIKADREVIEGESASENFDVALWAYNDLETFIMSIDDSIHTEDYKKQLIIKRLESLKSFGWPKRINAAIARIKSGKPANAQRLADLFITRQKMLFHFRLFGKETSRYNLSEYTRISKYLVLERAMDLDVGEVYRMTSEFLQ